MMNIANNSDDVYNKHNNNNNNALIVRLRIVHWWQLYYVIQLLLKLWEISFYEYIFYYYRNIIYDGEAYHFSFSAYCNFVQNNMFIFQKTNS